MVWECPPFPVRALRTWLTSDILQLRMRSWEGKSVAGCCCRICIFAGATNSYIAPLAYGVTFLFPVIGGGAHMLGVGCFDVSVTLLCTSASVVSASSATSSVARSNFTPLQVCPGVV